MILRVDKMFLCNFRFDFYMFIEFEKYTSKDSVILIFKYLYERGSILTYWLGLNFFKCRATFSFDSFHRDMDLNFLNCREAFSFDSLYLMMLNAAMYEIS